MKPSMVAIAFVVSAYLLMPLQTLSVAQVQGARVSACVGWKCLTLWHHARATMAGVCYYYGPVRVVVSWQSSGRGH